LPEILFLVLSGVTAVLVATEFLAAITTMWIDTTDRNVKKAKMPRNINYVKMSGVPVIDPDTNMCGICNVQVGEMTKHCKVMDHYSLSLHQMIILLYLSSITI
jgi:hypothetical protein